MAVEKQRVSWDEIERMVLALAEQVRGEYDLMLAVTRGGLVPAGLLAYKLEIRNILVAAVEFYNDDRKLGDSPTFLQFPADPLLRGQRVLVVDDLIATGGTASAAVKLARMAGGEVAGVSCLIELTALAGAKALDVPCRAVLRY